MLRPAPVIIDCASWFPDQCDSFFIVLIAGDSIADASRTIHKIIPVFETHKENSRHKAMAAARIQDMDIMLPI